MRYLVKAAAIGAVVLATVGGAMAADVIAERKAGFKANADATRAIKAAVDAGKPADAVAHAETVAAYAARIPSLFPAGSGEGDTRAKPEIWAEFARFEQLAAANGEAAAKLAEIARSGGDAAAVGAQLGELGKTCGACHDPFRKPAS